MGDHIGRAGSGLVCRKRKGDLGVHDGDLGPDVVAVDAALESQLVVAHNAAVACLAAGSGDGEHSHNRQRVDIGRLDFLGKEIPDVSLVRHAHGDGLGSVDGGAATQGDDDVDVMRACELDASAHR